MLSRSFQGAEDPPSTSHQCRPTPSHISREQLHRTSFIFPQQRSKATIFPPLISTNLGAPSYILHLGSRSLASPHAGNHSATIQTCSSSPSSFPSTRKASRISAILFIIGDMENKSTFLAELFLPIPPLRVEWWQAYGLQLLI